MIVPRHLKPKVERATKHTVNACLETRILEETESAKISSGIFALKQALRISLGEKNWRRLRDKISFLLILNKNGILIFLILSSFGAPKLTLNHEDLLYTNLYTYALICILDNNVHWIDSSLYR